jgi:hypothetical protein
MAALTGKKPKNTYKDLLQVSNSNAGIDSTLRFVSDGEGTDSTLKLSTTSISTTSKVVVGGDTAAGDDAAIGYTSAEGLIITGQGSTSDITVKNDADAAVMTVATGTTNVDIVGDVTASTVNADGDTSAGDDAAMGYTSAEGLILTGQGSTNDVTIKNDADADVLTIATGGTNVDIVGDVTASTVNADGDTSAGDDAAMGYTSAEGLILTGQGSTNDVTIKNDADQDVLEIPTGTQNVTMAGNLSVAGDLTITGDDLTMSTNTSGAALIADGTNFNPVVISGDAAIATNGALTIANDAVTLAKMAGLARGKLIYGDSSGDPAALAVGSANNVLKTDGTDVSWGTVATAGIADDAITSAKIADDAVVTASIADDAITSALIADDAVVSAAIADNAVTTALINDDAVTLAKMAGLARGKLIYGDSSGNPAALAVGSANYVLTSDGTDFAWAAASSGAVTSYTNSTDNRVITSVNSTTINGEANLTFDGSVLAVTGNVTASGTVEPAGDTSAGDNAAIGYTSAEGLILTGQGSTSDLTVKNDADGTVFSIPTGTDDILFPDNAKAMWGDGSDLQIYHDATDSHVADNGTGRLLVRTNGASINFFKDTSETMAVMNTDGSVDLYHDNVKKLETTAVGTTITGTLIATTDTDTSNTGSVTLDFGANQNFVLTFTGNVTLANPSTEQVGQSGVICCIQDGTGSRTLSLGTDYETAGGSGITLSTAGGAVDIIPYFVKASGSIQLGAVQKAFS